MWHFGTLSDWCTHNTIRVIYLRYFVMAWEITAWNEIIDTTSKDLWLIRSPTFIVPNPPAPAACAILVCSFAFALEFYGVGKTR